MDDDQIGALRDFVSAAWHYFTASKPDAATRRIELCEAVGSLLYALEGPLPNEPYDDDDPDCDDDLDDLEVGIPPTDPDVPPRPRRSKSFPPGAKVIPLHGHRRISRCPKGRRR
jgi:hypothetical protein